MCEASHVRTGHVICDRGLTCELFAVTDSFCVSMVALYQARGFGSTSPKSLRSAVV